MRVLARDACEDVAALRLFLNQDPLRERVWAIDRGEPEIAVAFMQEVADGEAGARHFLHVVPERSHARHDLDAALRRSDTGRHLHT
jgi:hypothetical protein